MKRRMLPDLRNARAGIEPKRLAKADAAVKPLGYRIVNDAADPTTTELWLYDEIGMWGISAADVVTQLAEISTPNLRVRINSPGGDVFDGIAIMNALASHPSTVTGVVDSLCASIATAIAMACETLTMSPGSQMMIHPASGMCFGDAADMTQMAGLLDFQTNNIAGLYANRAGGDQADWLSLMQSETWMTAEQAVTAGLADATGVVKQSGTSAVPAPPAWEDMWDLSVYRIAAHAKAPAPDCNIGGSDSTANVVVRCRCHPAGTETAQTLLALAHTVDGCPLFTDDKKPPAIAPLTVKWDLVTHPSDSATGTCVECDELASDGPYLIDDFPALPVHPNCECSMEPASVDYGDNAADLPPITSTAGPVGVEFDAELFRSTMREVFA